MKRRIGMLTKKSSLEKAREAGRRAIVAAVAATRTMMKSVRTAMEMLTRKP